MARRYGNPKKKSRFICLKCLKENCIGQGIQRARQREKFHIKDLDCLYCRETTKNIEVRYCDWYFEIEEVANQLHNELYNSDNAEYFCYIEA